MDVVFNIGWKLLPMSLKMGVGMYYVVSNARKTYETVAWVSNMMPSRNRGEVEQDEPYWVWVGEDKFDELNIEKVA